MLGAIRDHGEDVVTQVLSTALAQGRIDSLGIRHHQTEEAHILECLVPVPLQHVHIEAGRAADYDHLLIVGLQ